MISAAVPATESPRRPRWLMATLACGFGIALALAVSEAAAQLYCAVLQGRWKALRTQPSHLFQGADNPVFSYELKRNYVFDDGKRRVVLNAQGIRDTRAVSATNHWKAAFLGDSVAFGQGLDQKEVFTEILQEEFKRQGRQIKVLNFGVPGYDAGDLAENLRIKDAYYQADAYYYLLNLNDYARKNTRFEGADNGLYRMYRLPPLKTPMFIRKAIYRWHKQGQMTSPGWYRWMVDNNREWGAGQIQAMATHARARQKAFTVLILPGGCAYEGGHYGLQDLHDAIGTDLEGRGMKVMDLAEPLRPKHAGWFDKTDHLTPNGNRRLAEIVEQLVLADVTKVITPQ